MNDLAAVRYRAVLAYDGTGYQGFQRQAGETPTIQAAVEKAISAIMGKPIAVIGAGTVVSEDVEPFTVVAGDPMRVVRRLRRTG